MVWWLGVVLLVGEAVGGPLCLPWSPEGVTSPKSRPEGKFTLTISGNPKFYRPGEMYTVRLEGLGGPDQVPPTFTEFSVYGDAGSWYLFSDGLTRFAASCPGIVLHSNHAPKTEIQLLWTAPPQGSPCVTFRATVVESKEVWYQDDGGLSRTLCEDSQASSDDQPSVNQVCCACDEAKYEMTFEGLWSRHTHPKDFPSNSSWLPRFSDVIGASHTTDYRFWDYGGIASEGLKQVSEKGSTRMLESELKSQSQHIRTIIKARGISYPNVTSKTFAVFRVDNKHHLMSIVSMIDPSPDWIVGVSGLELCLSNCSWLETKVLNLYPWDAGTDSGITYTSPDLPTEPRDHIRRITSSFPNDPRSPFYDPTGEEMKPLARLYLTRERLYEKSCTEQNIDYNNQEACEVGEWTEWGPCSATCGIGKKTKQRFYKDQSKADLNLCKRELTKRATCSANFPCSRFEMGVEGNIHDDVTDERCALTEWSTWSGCSVACGIGVKHRFRALKNRRSWKYCMTVLTQQDAECMGDEGPCPQGGEGGGEEGPLLMAASSGDCEVTSWSTWSPCSVTCGSGGIRKRVRRPSVPHREPGWEERCPGITTEETMSCEGELRSCRLTQQEAYEVCKLPKAVGPCRGSYEKWFFDVLTQTCHRFSYSGCAGNRNQFESEDECQEACKEVKEELIVNRTLRLQRFGLSLTGSISNLNDAHEESGELPPTVGDIEIHSQHRELYSEVSRPHGSVVDCRVSNWTPWSSCSVSCGRGLRERSRHIMTHSKNGGKVCPKRLLKRRKCNMGPCSSGYDRDYYPSEEDDSTYKEDCSYTEWTQWSHCSVSCGPNSVQQRTRAIDLLRSPSATLCSDRKQTKVCNVPPCPPRPH